MAERSREVSPGPRARTVRTAEGEVLTVPGGWELLPPGDAGLTRRVKAGGATWAVYERRGRRRFSQGVWAPARRIAAVRADLAVERARPEYARKLETDRRRRAREQAAYADDFRVAVLEFLAFAPQHHGLALMLAQAIADHAAPVGSGTVARTKRIPLARRAEAATIAWLRHQTTAYDSMAIPREKGRRREVRRALAQHSRRLLAGYRAGRSIDPDACPLRHGLSRAGLEPDLDELPFEL